MPVTRLITWEIERDGVSIVITVGDNPRPVKITIDDGVQTPIILEIEDSDALRFARVLECIVADGS